MFGLAGREAGRLRQQRPESINRDQSFGFIYFCLNNAEARRFPIHDARSE
jgi:hypothetical protein